MKLKTVTTALMYVIVSYVLVNFSSSQLLAANKSSTTSKKQVTKHLENIKDFTRYMRSWGYLYYELAGCEKLDVSSDSELKETIRIVGGSWVLHDKRANSGTYGVRHGTGDISKVTLKNPAKYGVNYSLKPIKRKVSTEKLLRRVQWFMDLFMHWSQRVSPSPYAIWNSVEELERAYAAEKPGLSEDPHLALYWLMHFGYSFDDRYQEVKKIIVTNRLDQKLKYISQAISFFEHTSPFDDVKIGSRYENKKELQQIFLRRRAYLVYSTSTYKYRAGKNGLRRWWLSISLFPYKEKMIIRRIRWLAKNLKKYNQWRDFSNHIVNYKNIEKVSLLSYVYALNPGTKNKSDYAHKFLEELIDGKQTWKDDLSRKFARVMMWDVRKLVSNKQLLKKAVDIYFSGDTISKEYQDIMTVIDKNYVGHKVGGVRKVLLELRALEKDLNKDEVSKKQKAIIYAKIDSILKQQSSKILLQIVNNVDTRRMDEVAGRIFGYLFMADIPNKNSIVLSLFARMKLNDYDIPKIFDKNYPIIFKNSKDPKLALAKQMLTLPVDKFKYPRKVKNSREAVLMFFVGSIHKDNVLDYILGILRDKKYSYYQELKSSIMTHLLSKRRYQSKTSPIHKLSQKQIEKVLDSLVWVLNNPDRKFWYIRKKVIRTIYRCDHPLAKQWMLKRLNNKKWLEQSPNVKIGFGGNLREELRDAIKASLEAIVKREKNK